MDENHKQTRSDNGLETLQAVHRLNSNKAKIWWSWLRDRGTSSHRYVQNTPITREDSMRVLVAELCLNCSACDLPLRPKRSKSAGLHVPLVQALN